MKRAVQLAMIALLAMAAGSAAAQTVDCAAERCAFQDAVNASCPCDGAQFTNHGRYVSCVAHVVNDLARNGMLHTQCKGKVTRCAARSTCGKEGFVTCTVPVAFGTCDLLTGLCTSGVSATGTCAADTDCVTATKCSTKRDASHCTKPGAVIGSGTCCAACVTPVP